MTEAHPHISIKVPTLYRGFSPGIKYTGFNWHAETYLTDALDTACIYGRMGETKRVEVPSNLMVVIAKDDRVRDIENSPNPKYRALAMGIQAVWNNTNHWIGKTHPHEFILFDNIPIRFADLTKSEQKRCNEIKNALMPQRVATRWLDRDR